MQIPGYSGPSPAARVFTVGATKCAIDVYFDATSHTYDMILGEQFADGTWHYISDGGTPVWMLFSKDSPVSSGQGFGLPGGGNQYTGDFEAIVNHYGPQGMVYAWEVNLNKLLAARFPNGASSGGTVGSGPSENAGDKIARQIVAGGIASLVVTVNANSPPTVGHT